jgi:hypothetical protein
VLSLIQVVNLNRIHTILHSMDIMVHHITHPSMVIMVHPIMAIMVHPTTQVSMGDTMVIMVHLITHLLEDIKVKLLQVNRIHVVDLTQRSLEKRWNSSVKK